MQFYLHGLVFGTLFVLCMTNPHIQNLTHALANCGGKETASALLDISKDFIKKAKNQFSNCANDDQNCAQKEKSFAFLDVALNVIDEVKKGYPTCPEPEIPEVVEKHLDCSDILRSGKKESGVYTIWPRSLVSTNKSIAVYCDMDTDGGGWTVVQRRGRFSTPKDYFYKDWNSYKNGFGDLKEEFWLGNDNIFAISNIAFLLNKPYKIRFDLKDDSGKEGYAEYSKFWIDDEAASYTLHIEGYKGDVGDSMIYHNKMKFSTKDRSISRFMGGPCAVEKQGAWWYESCEHANLNGLYQPGIVSDKGCTWVLWKNKRIGLSGVEMKLRS